MLVDFQCVLFDAVFIRWLRNRLVVGDFGSLVFFHLSTRLLKSTDVGIKGVDREPFSRYKSTGYSVQDILAISIAAASWVVSVAGKTGW